MPNILDQLNPAQLEAATPINGPLLVFAGAGSGKTRVLTARIAYLLQQGVPPYNILAITFTNKAAAEMRERVFRMVGPQAKDIWLSTFHAFCAKFLRLEADRLPGLNKSFVIYDADDSLALVKNCLKELNLDDKHFPPAGIQAAISNAKNTLLDPGAFAREADNFHQHKVAEVYDLYQRKLRQNNAVDFDDLLFLATRLLETDAEVLAKYQDKFRSSSSTNTRILTGPSTSWPATWLRGTATFRRRRRRPEYLRLARRRHPQHTRLRGRLP
jgi:DNA helicase-2/ATP-dependent DNA helicase PcrA